MNQFAALAVATSLCWIAVEHQTPACDPNTLDRSGVIALDNWPYCDFFVVQTNNGFALAMWQSGLWMFSEGDEVYGLAQRAERQSILIAGTVMSGRMVVEVEAVGVDLSSAQQAFYTRCHV